MKKLERIYRIEHGGDRKSDLNNSNVITQKELAKQLEDIEKVKAKENK